MEIVARIWTQKISVGLRKLNLGVVVSPGNRETIVKLKEYEQWVFKRKGTNRIISVEVQYQDLMEGERDVEGNGMLQAGVSGKRLA